VTDSNVVNGSRPAALLDALARIADDVAMQWADDVDENARFPTETIDALKKSGLLSAPVPVSLGGAGCDLGTLTAFCSRLGERCAASSMILAMHYIQLACIVEAGAGDPAVDAYLGRVVRDQRLIASVTSEVGVGGDLRRTLAPLEADGEGFTFAKDATTISYGAWADDLLLTLRRNPTAAEHDQCLVLALGGDFRLENPTTWNTLGMRGTCSPGARVSGRVRPWQVLPRGFADIAARTMVPYSHILWAGCWSGIAGDAVRRARRAVQREARRDPSRTPRGAAGIAELDCKLQLMHADLAGVTESYQHAVAARAGGSLDMGLALRLNNLKVNASRLVRDIVQESMEVCGIAAYRNDSESSLGRHLRDAMSAALMISNDRIMSTNATLHLVHKGEQSPTLRNLDG
jgi:acyl-CoA dehydrogenase